MSLRDCGVTLSEEKSGTKVPMEPGQPEMAGGEGGHSVFPGWTEKQERLID